jgi:predicted RecB family nuclease
MIFKRDKKRNAIRDLAKENQQLKERMNKAIETLEIEIKNLKEKRRMIMGILTPENGYLKIDIEIEIRRLEKYLDLLTEKGSDVK